MAEAQPAPEAAPVSPAPAPAAPQRPEDRIAALLDSQAHESVPAEAEAPAYEAPAEEAQPVEDAEAEADAPEAAQAEAEGEPETAEAVETIELENFNDLAEHMGVDVADLYGVPVPVTNPDGTAESVTVGQLKDGYVNAERLAVQQREFTQEREAAESKQAEATRAIEQRLTEAEGVLGLAERQLVQEYQLIDWNTLRGEDPAEWTAKQREFDARAGQLQAAKSQAVSHAQALMQEAAEVQAQEHAKLLEHEGAALLRAIPEWGDPEVADKGKAELKTYLQRQGFTESEVGQLHRHEHVLLARKAMLYDAQQGAAKAELKKVIKLGKRTMKPGAKPNPNQAKSDAVAAAKSSARKTGTVRDAANAISLLR